MQHNEKPIFDRDFHLAQLKRHNKNFSSDIIMLSVADIIRDQIQLLKETHKINLRRVLELNAASEPLEGKYDLIILNLSLHHENEIVPKLAYYKEHLKDGGVLIATLFGGGTLQELRRLLEQTELELKGGVSPRVIPMIDVKDAGRLMQLAGFSQVIALSEVLEVEYKSFKDQLNHPRKLGQSNCLVARNKKYVGRDFFNLAAQKAGSQGFVNTFEIISLTGVK